MEITVKKEDLNAVETGGGFRELTAVITIDSSKPLRSQKIALIYETLACFLEPMLSREFVEMLAEQLVEALDELGPVVSKAGYQYPDSWYSQTGVVDRLEQ